MELLPLENLKSMYRLKTMGAENCLSVATLLLFCVILIYHTRSSAPKYQRIFHKHSSSPLLIHMAAGTFEIVRYNYFHTETSDIFDLIACLLQSCTNLIMVKTLVRGNTTTRPTYQVAGLMRPPLGLCAFFSASPMMHRGSVKLVNSFVYTRIIIYVATKLRLDKRYWWSRIYADAVFYGAIIAVYESGIPAGVVVFVCMVKAVQQLNKWTSKNAEKGSNENPSADRLIVNGLLDVGLAELPAIRKHGKPPELELPVSDDYTSNAHVKTRIPGE